MTSKPNHGAPPFDALLAVFILETQNPSGTNLNENVSSSGYASLS